MNSNKREEYINFRQDLEVLKQTVDYKYIVESLGFKIENETQKELRGACVIHGGDCKTAFRFNKERGTWVCFTHQCQKIFGNDVIGLIKAALNVDFMDAVLYLKNFVGDIDVNITEINMRRERDRFIESSEQEAYIGKDVNEEALILFRSFRSDSFIKDGFSKKTLDFFEVGGGWVDKDYITRDVIPIRDAKSKLVAYALRDIRRDVYDTDRKYLFTAGFNKDKILYNLNNAKKYKYEKPFILVEGQKSVWRFHELGIYNVVAVMGSGITYGQKKLLYQYALKGIIVIFDNDSAGVLGIIKACEMFKGRLDVTPIFITEDGKDPSDLTDNQIYKYLKGYC